MLCGDLMSRIVKENCPAYPTTTKGRTASLQDKRYVMQCAAGGGCRGGRIRAVPAGDSPEGFPKRRVGDRRYGD